MVLSPRGGFGAESRAFERVASFGTHRETPMLTCLELRTVITQIAAI
jgi:hypothetical protein